MSRYLITTADEREWQFDRPVLFLGEWCRRYRRRHVWAGMDAVVAPPLAPRMEDKRKLLAATESLTEKLLVDLTAALNAFHGTSHQVRYWHLVLGHWLRRYVDVMVNRFATVRQALDRYDINGFSPVSADTPSLATNDSLSFIYACNDDGWNRRMYAAALARLGRAPDQSDAPGHHAIEAPEHRYVPRASAQAVDRLLSMLRRSTDAVVVRSYLTRREEATLALLLGQWPQLWRTPRLERVAVSAEARARLAMTGGHTDSAEAFLRAMLPKVIPVCYLEGYASLIAQADALGWPEQPRFVFTSNSYDTDEVFKVWAAGKAENGHPYFVGQHGSNYGTHFYAGNAAWPERAATDRFFSWGWSDDSGRVVPAFNFKIKPGGRPGDRAGHLLLVQDLIQHRVTPWDTDAEYGDYQEQQFRFVEALPAPIRSQAVVRLHGVHDTSRWDDAQRWRDRLPGQPLDEGITPFAELVGRSRLTVYSYDSSGVLEMLAANAPVLCFWPAGLEHVIDAARPAFERLRDVGVIVEDAAEAAAQVTRYWDDVLAWWHSSDVQSARASFCDRYSRTTATPARTLRRLLVAQAAAAAGRN